MDLLTSFSQHLEIEKNASPRTVQAYGRDVRSFLTHLENAGYRDCRSVADVWPAIAEQKNLMRDYLADLHRRRLEAATIARQSAAIRTFFRFLFLNGRISDIPAHLTGSGRSTRQRKLPKHLTEQLMTDLINTPNTTQPRGLRDRALLELMYGLGLRLSEVVDLDLGTLDLVAERIVVTGKGNKQRILPLLGHPAAALKRYLESRLTPSEMLDLLDGRLSRPLSREPVFLGRRQQRIAPRTIQYMVRKYTVEIAGTHGVTPHSLRHAFATHLLDHGAGIRVVQEMLGHEHLVTTQIYTHLSRAKLQQEFMRAHPRARKKDRHDDDTG